MTAWPPELVAELKSRVGLVEMIGRRVALKKRGREHVGLCPFHNEKTPSFTVSESKGFFHCFGCGAHGDAIDFAMRSSGLSFVEAVEQLAHQVGLEVSISVTSDTSSGTASSTTSGTSSSDAGNRPPATVEDPLPAHDDDAEARQRAARAKWDEARPTTASLVENYLRRARRIPLKLVPPALRFHPGLWHSRDHGTMPAMLAAATYDGEITAIQATFLDVVGLIDDPVKTAAQTARKTYGRLRGAAVQFGRIGDRITITESVEDALTIFAVAGAPVWAVLGAGNLVTVQIPPSVHEVVLGIDNDAAGREAAAKAAARFEREGRICLIAEPPGAKDFNQIMQQWI